MPPARTDAKGLTGQQRQAARLDAAGLMNYTEIADAVGVCIQTLSGWRRKPDYQSLRDELAARVDEMAIEQAVNIRVAAVRAVMRAVRHADAGLGDVVMGMDEDGNEVPRAPNADDVAKLGRLALDVYKTASAQTGVVETKRREVEVSPAEGALLELRATLAHASDAVIDGPDVE